jgi:hypothetical protein
VGTRPTRSVYDVTSVECDADKFFLASAGVPPQPVTSALAHRLGMPSMRCSIDGVLAVLAYVFPVSTESEIVLNRADRADWDGRFPSWFTLGIREAVHEIHRVDAILQACLAWSYSRKGVGVSAGHCWRFFELSRRAVRCHNSACLP